MPAKGLITVILFKVGKSQMKTVKKTISVLLILITLFGIFTACGKPVNALYVNAGAFYQFFAGSQGVYLEPYCGIDDTLSEEEAETIMYDYGYIDDNQLGKCEKYITKDLVAQICVRSSSFRISGNDQIKDVKKCCDSQAAIDSVAMGIFTLNNNYFEAKKKMSVDDCKTAVENLDSYEADAHFEEAEMIPVYKDDAIVINSDDAVFSNLSYRLIPDPYAEELAVNDTPSVSFMDFRSNGNINIESLSSNADMCMEYTIDIDTIPGKLDFFTARNNVFDVGGNIAIPTIGKILVLPDYKGDISRFENPETTGNESVLTPLAIKITNVKVKNGGGYTITGHEAVAEDYIDYEKTIAKNPLTSSILNAKISQIVKSKDIDKKFKVSLENGKLIVNYSGNIDIKGKDPWQNASPKIDFSATIGDFNFDQKNIWKIIFKKNEDAELKFDYKTTTEVKIETGSLRLSPKNNGNSGKKWELGKGFSGHWLSAVKNTRATAADSKGSTSIKIAQATVPLGYGFSIKLNVFITIELDGTISIHLDEKKGFNLKIHKVNGDINIDKKEIKDCEQDVEISANLQFRVDFCPEVDFMTQDIVDASIRFVVDINIVSAFYSEQHSEFSQNISMSPDDMQQVIDVNHNSDYHYCIDLSLRCHFEIVFFKTDNRKPCLVNTILTKFVRDFDAEKLKIEFKDICNKHEHFEDGVNSEGKKAPVKVAACTRGKENKASIETGTTGDIVLTSYKESLDKGESVFVELLELPKQAAEMAQFVEISSLDEKIVTASFDSTNNIIFMEGISPGSTEIKIKIPKLESGLVPILVWFMPDLSMGARKKIITDEETYFYVNYVSVTVNTFGETDDSQLKADSGEGNGSYGGGAGGGGSRL